ncbi:MAG: response regulator [Anaerolineae bacterium]
MKTETHILIIDDNVSLCHSLRNILKDELSDGDEICRVTMAHTGADGLAVLRKEACPESTAGPVHVTLLDIRLPDTLGTDLLSAIYEIRPDMPVIVVTAHASLETAVQALHVGAWAYVLKPLDMNEVLLTVRRAMEKLRLVERERRLTEQLRATHEAERKRAEELAHTSERLERELAERVQAEQALKESIVQIERAKREWETTADALPQCVCLLDDQRRVLRANRTVERWGLAQVVDVKGKDVHELFHPGCTDPACYLDAFWHRTWEGLVHDGFAECETHDPVLKRYLHIQVRPLSALGDEPQKATTSFAAVVVHDITERKQAEETLHESHRRLEETLTELKAAQEKMMQQTHLVAVGQLAAGIAQEFNNILASIVLHTQMSLRTKLPPRTREHLEIIAEGTEHAADLVQQILDFARRAMLRQESLDLALLLEKTISSLKRTLPENIEVDLAYGSGEYTIKGDPARIQRVIVNLAKNARDAMPEGGELHIGLDRVQTLPSSIPLASGGKAPQAGQEGEWVRVTVTDTGTGIPSDVLPRIYEPFFTTRTPLGSGLGLAQVHGIVKQHGGHIDVETQVRADADRGRSGGTTFSIYWPVVESQSEVPVREETDLVQGEGETILLVEDNPGVRAALTDCLKMLNYRVLVAANGREALVVFEEHQDEISLVISEWMMPGIGGPQLTRALKQRHPSVQVLMLTSHSLSQETKDTAPEGVVGWVQKPLKIEQLAELVAWALKEGQTSS